MRHKKAIILSFLVITITALLITSCEITDPTEGLEVRLNSKSRETLANAYIYDANTLEPVTANVQVTFTGDNASKIVDETNEHKTSFNAKNGILLFGIEDGTEFSSNSPFRVNVKLKADGFNDETTSIKFTSHGNHIVNLFMVNPATLPSNADTETFEAGSADNSGILNQDVEHTTTKGTKIEMQAGTALKASDGSPLVGQLTSNVTVVPFTSENRYNVQQDLSTSGNTKIAPVMKFTFSLSDRSGNSADNLSNQVSFSLPLPDGFESRYQPGETIYVWKQSSSNGSWKQVGQASINSSSSSSMKSNGITAASLEGYLDETGNLIFGNETSVCNSTLTITNLPPDFGSTIQFFDQEGTLAATTTNSTVELEIDDGGSTITSVRLNADLDDPFNTGIEIGNNISLNCGNNSTALNFPEELVSLRFEIVGVCTEKDPVVVVNPNVSFSYKKEGASTWQSGNLVNGKASIAGLEIGTIYEVTATYRDNSGNGRFEIISASEVNILELSNPENILSSSVDYSTTPPTLYYEIDLGDECD